MRAARVTHICSRRRARTACWALGLFVALGLLFATFASAAYEEVATFGSFGEFGETREPGEAGEAEREAGVASQLYYSKGMAVNTTGAGGVPAGTVYTTSFNNNDVIRYGPRGEFLAEWGWTVSRSGDEYQRCGPAGDPAHPICSPYGGSAGDEKGQLDSPIGIAVDQATGDVFVLSSASSVGTATGRGSGLVQVFTADGSEEIGSFGELSGAGETVDESPGKIHNSKVGGIAVGSSGTVYVSDSQGANCEGCRVMVFKPQSPGDYGHYVYTGRSHDIATTSGSTKYFPAQLAVDDAGDLFVGQEFALYKFSTGSPDPPVCEFKESRGGIQAMTVNPESGEVFYFTYKTKRLSQLSACNSQGEFSLKAQMKVVPETLELYALAFNPTYDWEEPREAGVLYAVDAEVANPKGRGSEGLGHIFAPEIVLDPIVESEGVSSVAASTATLRATINPKGSSTSYFFEYISQAAYDANEPGDRFAGAAVAPLGGGSLPAGQAAAAVGASISGLSPATEYHFRAVARSHCDPSDEAALCEGVGEDATFTTFPLEGRGLTDHRAYELVSPAEKNGGEVFPSEPGFGRCGGECKPGNSVQHFPMQATADGEAVVYEGFPFSSTEGATAYNEYLSTRTLSGWQTADPTPTLLGSGAPQGYVGISADLATGVIYGEQLGEQPALSPSAPDGYANLYLQATASPASLSPLVAGRPPNRSGSEFKIDFGGASEDFSRLFFSANDALTGPSAFAPEAADGGAGETNLYEFAGGQLRLVNVAPGNEATVPGAEFGSGVKLEAGNPLAFSRIATNAISADGSRAFFTGADGRLYVREDGEATRQIPAPGSCTTSLAPDERACFLTAATDGSRVLLSDGHLFNLANEEMVDLTQGKGGFRGILGQSNGLSRLYFVDTAVLTGEEESEQGTRAQDGERNLYLWNEGSISFIATLGEADNGAVGDWEASPSRRTAEASPDGRWLTFLSQVPLTGYQNLGPSCVLNSLGEYQTAPCFEVFLYDSATGRLSCPSCNPSGAPPLGRSRLAMIQQAGDTIPQPRYLTGAGRLYFDTQDSLTPFDTNDGVEDVYQYEPDGIGTCGRAAGCVSLISAGREPVDSNFLTMDESGKNVFFTTRDRLVPKDHDELIDLYDAREDGTAETETQTSGCQGESCQPPTSAPADSTPGSLSFQGTGNVAVRQRCLKGEHRVRRKGKLRCVRRDSRSRHRAHRKHRSKRRGRHGRPARHHHGGAK